MFLTADEIEQLTGYVIHAKQIEWLRRRLIFVEWIMPHPPLLPEAPPAIRCGNHPEMAQAI